MKILSLIIKVVGFLPGIILGVESIFGAGNGAKKKQAVVSSVDSILNSLELTGIVSDEVAAKYPSAVSKLIDAVVMFLNDTGLMASATAAATTVPAAPIPTAI